SLMRHNVTNVVIDPVMIAKSGDRLLAKEALNALKQHLLPLATVITPNMPEAEALTGINVRTKDEMIQAGRRLLAMGCEYVLVKGGHLPGDRADDVLLTSGDEIWFPASKIVTSNTHGTGCTLSAA